MMQDPNPPAAPSELAGLQQQLSQMQQQFHALVEMLARPKQYPEVPITPALWDKARGDQYPETQVRMASWQAECAAAAAGSKVEFPYDLNYAYHCVGALQAQGRSNFNGVFALNADGCVELVLHTITWVLQTQVRAQAAAQGRSVEEVWSDLHASARVVPPPVPAREKQGNAGQQQETAAVQNEAQASEGAVVNEAQDVNSISGG